MIQFLEPFAGRNQDAIHILVHTKVRDDNNCQARGSPPLEVVQRLLNILDDVGKSSAPFERVPSILGTPWKEIGFFLDVLAHIASGRRLVFRIDESPAKTKLASGSPGQSILLKEKDETPSRRRASSGLTSFR